MDELKALASCIPFYDPDDIHNQSMAYSIDPYSEKESSAPDISGVVPEFKNDLAEPKWKTFQFPTFNVPSDEQIVDKILAEQSFDLIFNRMRSVPVVNC